MPHAAFVGEHDGETGRQSRRVHRTIGRHGAIECAVLAERGEAMAKGSIHALAACQLEGTFLDPGQNLLVAGNHEIFAEKQEAIAHVPSVAPHGAGGPLVRIEIFLGQFPCEVTQLWQILRLPCSEQGQALDGPCPVGLHGLLFEHLDDAIEDPVRFLAVPWRCVAVAPQHGELQRGSLHLARTPNLELEDSVPGLRFRCLNGQCNRLASVVAEEFAIDTEDHIIHHDNTVGR